MTRFRVTAERSSVWIEASSSLHAIHSESNALEGWLEFALGDGEIDLSSTPSAHIELPIAGLSSGNPLYDREMRRRVDARRHPTISGDLTALEALGDGRYEARGELSFRGVGRPVEGELSITIDDERTIRVTGERVFDIRAFGMQPPQILMLKVHPDVKVRIEVLAERDD